MKTKILIFEGPSTSGKTTLANLLYRKLIKQGSKALLIGEDQTLMPVLNTQDFTKHFSNILKILDSVQMAGYDYIIIDRFHLTSAFVCGASISAFKEIEDKLIKFGALIIFLKIDESRLGERILKAMKHRSLSWRRHVTSKGTDKDIVKYYLGTQIKLLKLLKTSIIPYKIFDATNSEYEKISNQII